MVGVAVPVSTFAPVSAATVALAGERSSSAGVASCRSDPLSITPMRWARAVASSHACVTRSVGRPSWCELVAELVADLAAGERVERREWLVEEQHPRLSSERPGQRDALALTAGERSGARSGEMVDAEPLEQVGAGYGATAKRTLAVTLR